MRRVWFRTICALILACCSLASSQPKQWISFKADPFDYDYIKAARVWDNVRAENTPIYEYYLYQKYSVWFRDTSLIFPIMSFGVDSIRGRGASREALIAMSTKVSNDSDWVALLFTHDTTYVRPPDTSGMYWSAPIHVDTLYHTKDSTYKTLNWLPWTRPDYWNAPADSQGRGAGRWIDCQLMAKDSTYRVVTYFVEKIIGDPLKNGGVDQVVKLRFKYMVSPTREFLNLTR